MKLAVLLLAIIWFSPAQSPSGAIAGMVRDMSDAAIPGVQVRIIRDEIGLVRTAITSDYGTYNVSALPAGEYTVEAQSKGFQTLARMVIVETGITTTSNFLLLTGEVNTSVTVDGASPQIRYDSYTVGGSITRTQIEDLPLNGRSFLELAKLEPGVQPASRASSNRMFVPVLGAPQGNSGRGTRVTIDGGSIMTVGNGGSAMAFSQDAVQEFQISTVNFDLSTGATVSGAINVATRSGSNDLHGSASYFFRDHNLEAYPALIRDAGNPDPFFQRRQFGFVIGGPIRRDRIFFFGNWERNEQRGVGTTTLTDPDFAHFSRITVSPFWGNQASIRLDGHLSGTHTGFIRYTHDGNHAFGPLTTLPNTYPSSWPQQTAWADQSVLGLTSIFSSLVNEFRLSYFFASSKQLPSDEKDCAGCIAIGFPAITIAQAGLTLGSSDFGLSVGRRVHFNDAVMLQRGNHHLRFGGDWEHNRGGPMMWSNEPAMLTLYSPNQARQAAIPVPAQFQTTDDILKLPLRNVTVAVGDPRVPQAGGGIVRNWNTARLYIEDTWQVRSNVVATYGLGWSIDRNLNYDLRKPQLLAPIFGTNGLEPTRKQWTNFSPTLGFTWTPSAKATTAVRAGAGLFYDFSSPTTLDAERAALGPPGLGRQTFQGISLPNVLPDVPGVPVGTPLDFKTPTFFTGADLIEILPEIRSSLLSSPVITGASIQQMEISKTVAGFGGLNGRESPLPSALHVNAGVQHRLAKDFVLTVDLVYRHFDHVGLPSIDENHFKSVQGPLIPACTAIERNDPQALCSNGPINVFVPVGRATYKGLLVRADKRISRRFQFMGAWAYSRNTGTSPSNANGFDLNNWLGNHGPLSTDFTHIVNLAGVARLRWQLELGFNFSYSSAPPFSAYLGGYDLNGDGTTGDLLPGASVNVFNRGMGREELAHLVTQFNQMYAGKPDAFGAFLPTLALPARYALGDSFHALDLRLSRSFAFQDHARLTLIGDAFNVYNAANLSGHSGDLTNTATFGQPTARSTQVFGSGGPRAFQVAIRVSF